jgi:ATP adenylyltransferase
MDRLWTPWRYDYVVQTKRPIAPGVPEALAGWVESGAPVTDCVFCNMVAAIDYAVAQGMPMEQAEQSAYVLARGMTCFLCLNAFPYGTGHLLIVPYRHAASLVELPAEEATEMMLLV